MEAPPSRSLKLMVLERDSRALSPLITNVPSRLVTMGVAMAEVAARTRATIENFIVNGGIVEVSERRSRS